MSPIPNYYIVWWTSFPKNKFLPSPDKNSICTIKESIQIPIIVTTPRQIIVLGVCVWVFIQIIMSITWNTCDFQATVADFKENGKQTE